jgi:small subunit ribosomal protein S17
MATTTKKATTEKKTKKTAQAAPVAKVMVNTKQKPRRSMTGVVVSDKMMKTRVVRVDRSVRDSLYGKTTRKSSTVKVHDEKNLSKEGDLVDIVETRPISRDKRWALQSIVRASAGKVLITE